MTQRKSDSVLSLIYKLDKEFKNLQSPQKSDSKPKQPKQPKQPSPKKQTKELNQGHPFRVEKKQQKKIQTHIMKEIDQLQHTIQETADEIYNELKKELTNPITKSLKKDQIQIDSIYKPSQKTPDQPQKKAISKDQSKITLNEKHTSSSPDQTISSPTLEELEVFKKSNKKEAPFILNLSNHLKVAEKRIQELEKDNDHLKTKNQELILDRDVIQENLDQLSKKYKTIQNSHEDNLFDLREQKKSLEKTLNAQSDEINKLQSENNKLQIHLKQDVKKIRFRERELENRLELKNHETSAILREKDTLLLELKKEIDEMKSKINQYTLEQKKINKEKEDNNDRIHQAVRTLKTCIHLLKDEQSLKRNQPANESSSFEINKESSSMLQENTDQNLEKMISNNHQIPLKDSQNKIPA